MPRLCYLHENLSLIYVNLNNILTSNIITNNIQHFIYSILTITFVAIPFIQSLSYLSPTFFFLSLPLIISSSHPSLLFPFLPLFYLFLSPVSLFLCRCGYCLTPVIFLICMKLFFKSFHLLYTESNPSKEKYLR